MRWVFIFRLKVFKKLIYLFNLIFGRWGNFFLIFFFDCFLNEFINLFNWVLFLGCGFLFDKMKFNGIFDILVMGYFRYFFKWCFVVWVKVIFLLNLLNLVSIIMMY